MKSHLLSRTLEMSADLLEKGRFGLLLSPILIFLQKYIFADMEFLKWLVVLISLDTLLGLGGAICRKTVDRERFGDILVKIVVYGSCLIVGHVLENFTVSGEPIQGGHYMKVLIYCSILIKEAISIFNNLGKISKNLVPIAILKRLKAFDDSGELKDLDPAQDEEKPKNDGKKEN